MDTAEYRKSAEYRYRTAVDEARTVTDIRDARQIASAMNRKEALNAFWREMVAKYLLTQDVDLAERRKHWRSYSYDFDLDAFGTVKVVERQEDEYAPAHVLNTWDVNKADIFDMIDEDDARTTFEASIRLRGAAETVALLK